MRTIALEAHLDVVHRNDLDIRREREDVSDVLSLREDLRARRLTLNALELLDEGWMYQYLIGSVSCE